MNRSDRHLHRDIRRPRLLALPLVLVCAMAYVSGVLHFALVQHETCLEHGEVMHVDPAKPHEQPSAEEVSFADTRIARASQAATVSHGAEAHCAHAFFRREAPPPPVKTSPTVEALPSSERLPAVAYAQVEPVARLRLAPKSSPPLS